MKIYASRRLEDPLKVLRTFEGKDVWVRGVIDQEHDVYLNIDHIENEWVYTYILDTYYIKNFQYSGQICTAVRNYLRTYKQSKSFMSIITINQIKLYPEHGTYTTEDLLDMSEEVQ